MGLSFYKSKKIGIVKVNFSKSGVGISAGTKGARVGITAKGQGYVSGGANGIRYRKYTKITSTGSSKKVIGETCKGTIINEAGEEKEVNLVYKRVYGAGARAMLIIFGSLLLIFYLLFLIITIGVIGSGESSASWVILTILFLFFGMGLLTLQNKKEYFEVN
jgi:hypothetical protein